MNACVVITGDSMRVTVFPGGRPGIAIRIEDGEETDVLIGLDSDLARQIATTLHQLAERLDRDDE